MDDPSQTTAQIWGVVAGLTLTAVIVGSVMWTLLRAARKQPNAMITISLSVLTLVALAGFISTQSETLGAIAASGVGALGGALTALFQSPPPQDQDGPPPEQIGDH